MIKYNEWKLLQESVAPAFNLGLKSYPTVGGPVGGHGFQEGGFNFGKDEDDEEGDEDDDEDDDDFDDEDDDLEDDQLDGDIFGASKEEGGPAKSFPPDDSEDLDSEDDGMDDVLGGIDPDLAGLGDDKNFGGTGAIGGGGQGPQDDIGASLGGGDDMASLAGIGGDDMGDEMGGDLGAAFGGDEMGDEMGDDLGAIGGDEMGDDLGAIGGDEMGDDLGAIGGDEMGDAMGLGGEMGEPCPDCNPDGQGEPDPECMTCSGEGFLDDMGGEMGGEIGGDEIGQDIDKMNFLSKMMNYQKKYMSAAPMQGVQPQAQQQPQMTPQQMQQMQQQMQQMQQKMPQQSFQKKFMAAKPVARPVAKPSHLKTHTVDNGDDMAHPKKVMPHVKHMGACCQHENVVGTTKETHDDFLANLANCAKGETRRKFHSGIYEDALLQAVDPTYQADPQAGQVGFAPQSRVGSIGGGYTQQDMQDLPVLGENKKFPTLEQYKAAKAKKSKKR